MVISLGEWAIKPFYSSEKELQDPDTPEEPHTICNMNNELCKFLYANFVKGISTPWLHQRYGQIAQRKFYDDF